MEEQIQAIYGILDGMLSSTTERQMVSVVEVQNWMLDMRSEVAKLQESLQPVAV